MMWTHALLRPAAAAVTRTPHLASSVRAHAGPDGPGDGDDCDHAQHKKSFPVVGPDGPDSPDDHAQHYLYSRALQYVRQCFSVSVRASAANPILAFAERAHAGMLVPTAAAVGI